MVIDSTDRTGEIATCSLAGRARLGAVGRAPPLRGSRSPEKRLEADMTFEFGVNTACKLSRNPIRFRFNPQPLWRQGQRHHRPAVNFALQGDRSAMGFDQAFDDRQAEA